MTLELINCKNSWIRYVTIYGTYCINAHTYNNVYLLSCNTDEATQLYYGGCLLSVQSENEIEEAAEVENKSDLICTSLSGCVYYLPVPVVTPNQTLLTGGFKIVVFTLEKLHGVSNRFLK